MLGQCEEWLSGFYTQLIVGVWPPPLSEGIPIATFLLVHGAFHGSWCWQRLVLELAARGHNVEALDLAQPGDEPRDAAVLLHGWAEQVAERARCQPEPVILVGHSRGGIVISEAAERAPDRVARLVYCAAMLVDDGETMTAMRARLDAPAGPTIHLHRERGGTMFRADPESAAALIYSAAAPADREPLIGAMVSEFRASFQIAPHLTRENYGRVPRAYIECLQDRAIAIGLQRRMRETQPCDLVITLDADHAPYLSVPQALAEALDTTARADSQKERDDDHP